MSGSKIRKFDISKMKTDATIIMIGKRGSGKSYLIKDIMYQHKDNFPYGSVVSGTEELNNFFCDFIPKLYITKNYNTQNIERLLNIQKFGIKKYGKSKQNNAFLILDDCIHQSDLFNRDSNFKEIFTNGRHYNIFFMIALQYSLGIPPTMRGNVDYIFLFAHYSREDKKKLYETYASCFDDYHHFDRVFTEITKDHRCMVIDNTRHSHDYKDKIFYYKVDVEDLPTSFKVGSLSYWGFHENNYKEMDPSILNEYQAKKNIKKIKKEYNIVLED